MADHGWSQEQHPDIEDLLQRMARCEQLEEAWDVNSLGFGFRSTFIEVWNDDSPSLGYGPWGAFSHGETLQSFFAWEALQSDLQSQQGLLETLQAQDFKNVL